MPFWIDSSTRSSAGRLQSIDRDAITTTASVAIGQLTRVESSTNPAEDFTNASTCNTTENGNTANEPEKLDSLAERAVTLLAARCTECHGVQKQEAGLRLDSADGVAAGGDSGEVIDLQSVEKSRLLQYVRGEGDSLMPPDGQRLSAEEIMLLRDWIQSGAKWASPNGLPTLLESSKHWAFQPIVLPAVPPQLHGQWCKHEIDRFVAEKLNNVQLSPAMPADRATLIRRLSFDLRGLPANTDEIDQFQSSNDPTSYEQLVDRYLASPEFGERWGRHWLDRTQYGESSGCVIDVVRPYPWRWRDWIVESINDDMPFDQFTKLQLAGDLLPDASADSLVATGFYRNALTNHEAGTDPYHEFSKTTVDRTSLVASTWLELTVGCAECHSHKYDPITQRDFYRMYAFFNNLQDRIIDGSNRQDADQVLRIENDVRQAAKQYAANVSQSQLAWERSICSLPEIWQSPTKYEPRSLRTTAFAQVHLRDDGSMDIDGRVRKRDELLLVFETSLPEIHAIRLELLPSADRFHSGPGRGWSGSCVLTSATVSLSNPDASELESVKIAKIITDYCQDGFDAADALLPTADEKCTGWSSDHKGLSHSAILILEKPLRPENNRIKVMLAFNAGEGRSPARCKLSVANCSVDQLHNQFVPSDIRELVRQPSSTRSAIQQATIKRYYQSTHESKSVEFIEWNRMLDQAASWISPRGAEVVQESKRSQPTFVRLRGEFNRPGPEVTPGIPSAFDFDSEQDSMESRSPKSQTANRIALSEWVVHPKNPLTARVMVNDVWQHLFGVGLVRSSGDFGKQGDPPTHPELLDWLAHRLMHEFAWSRKRLIRTIVTSATYQQSAIAHESTRVDPQNLLLGRQNRFRLEAEVLRDAILERLGLLATEIGGPTFHPAEPNGTSEFYYDWDQGHLLPQSHAIYRRGLYISARRTIGDPMLSNFDAPSGNNSCPARQRTNTPLQAVSLLNDPLMIEAAKEIGKRFQPESAEDADVAMIKIWKHCLGRDPTENELQQLIQLKADLAKLPSMDEPQKIWFMIARAVINLDEMTTRE